MTRKEAERLAKQQAVLQSLGFTAEEAEQLRRISMTLQRWFEHECNGDIQRDETSGVTYRHYGHNSSGPFLTTRTADRETGAKKRLAKILARRNSDEVRHTSCATCGLDIEGIAPFSEWRDRGNNTGDEHHKHAPAQDGSWGSMSAYIQTDPRGAALYIIRPGDVPPGSSVDSCYSRGICVY